MKIMFLNTWAGKVGKPLLNFIEERSKHADIFCFQEVSVSLNLKLNQVLRDFNGIYRTGCSVSDNNESCGQSTYVRKSFQFVKNEKILLHKIESKDIGFLLFTQLEVNGTKINIGNVHGKSKPGNKLDSDIRLNQSKIILNAFKNIKGPKIIGGDFNLLPDTKSIEMIENEGFVNLIKKDKIRSTRNSYSWDRFKNRKGFVKQNFADYVFISKDVKVNSFEVPQVLISDHNPMILDFEL